jgi:hypothetical protein
VHAEVGAARGNYADTKSMFVSQSAYIERTRSRFIEDIGEYRGAPV